ncbi:zinc finger protein 40 isoform X1 [Lepisosteus oculatus]|uniref:zinc finger protein 40 isoform X1 n=1 Tax=Lepisosteus oculatus TaxID=7918 RepID=UPI0035F50E88
MPRTKQNHPKNLKDKIEEAQKELKDPDDSQKGTNENGRRGTDAVKGLKRKKVVTENHLKKIPKSPVKKPSQTKISASTAKAGTPSSAFPSSLNNLSTSPVKNGNLEDDKHMQKPPQSKAVNSEAALKSDDGEGLMQTEASVGQQQPFDPCQGQEAEEQQQGGKSQWRVKDKPSLLQEVTTRQPPTASMLSETWSCKSSGSPPGISNSASPSHASASLEVLLKAMEPDLSSLTQKKSSLSIAPAGNPGPIQVQSTGQTTGMSSVNMRVQQLPSLSQSELLSGQHLYSSIPQTVQIPPALKSGQALNQTVSQLHYQHTPVLSTGGQQNPQKTVQDFTQSATHHQKSQEKHGFQQSYNVAPMPSVNHAPVPSGPQALSQSQPVVHTCQSASASVPSNQVQMATIINPAVETMCNISVKDQKPKKQGKYVCEYCNRACAKPSVLLKHIRSHTGERPYPCVTCGFSFKTKSNLYKHKKSHAHAIKLGLVIRPDSSSGILSQESDKALGTHSDVEESGESDDESTADERNLDPESSQSSLTALSESSVQNSSSTQGNLLDEPLAAYEIAKSGTNQNSSEPKVTAALPKVVVYPVNVSPLRADSPRVMDSAPELSTAQRQRDFQTASIRSNVMVLSSLKEVDGNSLQQESVSDDEDQPPKSPPGGGHAQLQRQQATDFSQQQQGKCLLSPRSLGSTDSGYFSRSESADQTMSPPSPFVKIISAVEMDVNKSPLTGIPSVVMSANYAEKLSAVPGQMRPPLETKSLEERISKLISDNEALVDDKQLDSVKPRRTSLSRRGSIDSPKSYIFKDSFQFDLKPMSRRTSSSSDIPKSPFTPTDKSKQVFLLSVPPQYPSMDCLPITRSNSMPATPGYSALPPNVAPGTHPPRCQSFDEKIGSFNDDVFLSGPPTPNPAVHPRTLVRQTAIEDSSTSEGHSLASTRSVDESYHGSTLAAEIMPRSKSFEHGPGPEKTKKSQQSRGTMYECETCRNRYRKLENFENHKKFYCSELHGPKSKTVSTRETDQDTVPRNTQPHVFHYIVTGATGVLEQPPLIRKRRKMKSVGDDDEQSPTETTAPSSGSFDSVSSQMLKDVQGRIFSSHTSVMVDPKPTSSKAQTSQVQLVARGTETVDSRLSPIREAQISVTGKERGDIKRQGSGISVIQHTNSLSRPSSFDKSESFERGSPVNLQEKEIQSKTKPMPISRVTTSKDGHSELAPIQKQPVTPEKPRADQHDDRISVPCENVVPVQQSRLVRQNNIQVPEILVTEEPDREQESQVNEQEKPVETFNWPQRSESLSKLPTEKLPPKKKRIRLAEIEHSSGESSFESTLSRSLSRDSSLSRCSSISASFDREEVTKPESPLKTEGIGKPPEYQGPPVGCNTLGVPGSHSREMRRAASEQISCTQPSVEVTSEYRSKSFDCGSISPTRSLSPMETVLPKTPAVTGVQVPLIERRRGPLVRQMSLKIGPETQQQRGNLPMSFQHGSSVNMAPVQQHKLQAASRSSMQPMMMHSASHGDIFQNKSENLVQSVNLGSQTSTQHPPVYGLPHPWQHISTGLSGQRVQRSSGQILAGQGEIQNNSAVTLDLQEKKNYVPKYQLQVSPLKTSQSYLLPSASSSVPVISLPVSNEVITVSKPSDAIQNLYMVPQVQQIIATPSPGPIQPVASIVLPGTLQNNSSSFSLANLTSLPQILVTQDQVNSSCATACKVSTAPVQITDTDIRSLPHVQQDKPQASVNPQVKYIQVIENQNPIGESRNMSTLGATNCVQKIQPVGLYPQQEPTASSKRMLSPANSLDIAMEKHQKRAKDEHGSACSTDGRSLNFLNTRMGEVTRQRKLMLVRQVCTTEPADSPLDSENSQQHLEKPEIEKVVNSQASKTCIPRATEAIGEVSEKEMPAVYPVSNSVIRMSPGPPVSPQTAHSALKSQGKTEERSSAKTQLRSQSFQGQVKLASSVSVVNARDSHRLSFPSLKTTTSFTWCFLMKRKPLHVLQADQRISAYATWSISTNNPNPLGLPTKVALSLFNSKQKAKKTHYTQAITTSSKSDILAYSSKLKNSLPKVLAPQTSLPKEKNNKGKAENQQTSESDKESSTKSEPRRVKIFDGGYKSNEDYVYVRGRGRGKYICEECGIRCKKPSMLRKHIRTHTDVRPYHCTYCNFSFKTKGNLTKHMKSKAHSKKCMEMGVSVGLIDDQDAEESGDKGRLGYERPGSDVEDSDGADDDDNDNEEEDEEDSQAESVLSATPSVTASPQHHPAGSSHSEFPSSASADEQQRVTRSLARLDTALLETLPSALLAQMSISGDAFPLSTKEVQASSTHRSPGTETESDAVAMLSPKSPCRQMSIDYPEQDDPLSPSASNKVSEPSKVHLPGGQSCQQSEAGLPVDRSTQTNLVPASVYTAPPLQPQFLPQSQIDPAAAPTHLFSHLPLHSQQPTRTPYSMIPVGGIQLVPAGLAAYSTFVPIQAGPVQLTIPAVSVIHRTASPHGEKSPEGAPCAGNPLAMTEQVNNVLPCIPIGQVSVTGLQTLSTQTLQPLPALGLETLNIVGLANSNIAPQVHPQSLTLNALGLQVLAANPPSQNCPSPQAHIPGLQILNIALPTLIPSVSPIAAESQGGEETSNVNSKPCDATLTQGSIIPPGDVDINTAGRALTPQTSTSIQLRDLEITPSNRPELPSGSRSTAESAKCDEEVASRPKAGPETAPLQSTRGSAIEHFVKGSEEEVSKQEASPGGSCEARPQGCPGAPRRQITVEYNDVSSDDEDRLVIAT